MECLDVFFGDSIEDLITTTISKEGPWYADMYKDNNIFYQIRARYNENKCKNEIHLCYKRSIKKNSIQESTKRLKGEWWLKKMPYLLSDYRESKHTTDYISTDFANRVITRLKNGYHSNVMRLPFLKILDIKGILNKYHIEYWKL